MPTQAPLLQILRRPPAAPAEKCDFCGAGIDAVHGHLVDVPRRALLCVCRPCYLLFTHDGAGGKRFRPVPQRYAAVPELAGAGEHWDALQVPIGLAFFFRTSTTGRTTAFYPSPAGATESELPLEAWDAIVSAAPTLQSLADDVEALLVWRRSASPQGGMRGEDGLHALIVPIDACYELVGRIRRSWRGFQGGDELWQEVDGFFARAAQLAQAGAA